MSQTKTCGRCGAEMLTETAGGLCPRCLMALNFETRTMPEEEAPQMAAPLSPEEMRELFPQFEVLECLGRGGMGVVYRARQKTLDRIVAIKVLAGEWHGDPGFAKRFEKEAKTLAQMNHPNIVTVHDFGETNGLYYIVMEYVDGVNLRDVLHEGTLPPEQALAIVPPICDALQYAHDKGIVHRDIKPENLLLDREGRIKIADFGIAALLGTDGDSAGTPPYMAPEQSGASAEVDSRADIYALGAVLYEMLTGERPNKDLVAPSKKVQIDVRLDEIVLRALEKTPELRFQTAVEFRTQVEEAVASRAATLYQDRSKTRTQGGVAVSNDAEIRSSAEPSGRISSWSAGALIGSAIGIGSWMPMTAIMSDWSGAGVGLSYLTTLAVMVAALVVWNFRGRQPARWGYMVLLASGFVSTLAFLCVADALGLKAHTSHLPGSPMVSPWTMAWMLLLYPALWLGYFLIDRRGALKGGSDGGTGSSPPDASSAPRRTNPVALVVGVGIMVLCGFGMQTLLNHWKKSDQAQVGTTFSAQANAFSSDPKSTTPTFESVTDAAHKLIAKHFPDAVITSDAEEFKATFATREYEIHGGSKTGEIAKDAQKQIGPSPNGFILSVRRQNEIGQAELPQFFDRPYWKTYGNLAIDPKTGLGVVAYLDFGSGLNSEFKAAMLKLLAFDNSATAQPADATPAPQNTDFSEKTQRTVDALLPNIGKLTIALEHYPQESIGHSLAIRTKRESEPNFYISPLISDEQMKKLLLHLAADGYFDRASGGPLPPQSSEMPIQAGNQPGYLLSVFCPESPRDSNHYTFHEDLSLKQGAALQAAKSLRSAVEGEAATAVDMILREMDEQPSPEVSQKNKAPHYLIFDPVMERVVNDPLATREKAALRFDSGELVSIPDSVTLTKWGVLPDGPDVPWDRDPSAWARSVHVDAMAYIKPNDGTVVGGPRCGLLCPQTLAVPAADNAWEQMTPEALTKTIEEKDSERSPVWGDSILETEGRFPATFLLLNTRTRRMGMVQIIGVSEKPAGVKIRYRMIHQTGQPVLNAAWTFESVKTEARKLISKHFPDAVVTVDTEKNFKIQHDTREYEFASIGHTMGEKTGPDAKGFMLSIRCTSVETLDALATPQILKEPYGETFANKVIDPQTGKGALVFFSYAAELDAGFKAAMMDLLKLDGPGVAKMPTAATFGPVIERVVKEAIDLDTGNLAAMPQPDVRTDNSEKDKAAVQAKLRERGLDAFVGEYVWVLDVKLKQLPNEDWDTITPERLTSALGFVRTAPSPEDVIRSAMPPPATFAFQTREGGIGVLQNFGRMADNSGVKIRYKLLRGENDASPPDTGSNPRSPADNNRVGTLGYKLGTYLTIGGVRAEEGKVGTHTLLVDTIGGNTLDKPIGIWIENVELPKGERCVLKGYETGSMIGTPDEVLRATGAPQPQAKWQFHFHFIATSVEQPGNLKLTSDGPPTEIVFNTNQLQDVQQRWAQALRDQEQALREMAELTAKSDLSAAEREAQERPIKIKLHDLESEIIRIRALVQQLSPPPSTPVAREIAEASELKGQKYVESFRAPLELVEAAGLADGGSLGYVFKDSQSHNLEFVLNRADAADYPKGTHDRLYVGSMYKDDASLSASGGKAEKLVLSLLQQWVKEHVPEKTANELRSRKPGLGLSETELRQMHVIDVMDTLAKRNGDSPPPLSPPGQGSSAIPSPAPAGREKELEQRLAKMQQDLALSVEAREKLAKDLAVEKESAAAKVAQDAAIAEAKAAKLVEAIRGPLELVEANAYTVEANPDKDEDGGSLGCVFKDAQSLTLEFVLDRSDDGGPSSPRYNRLFVGAKTPDDPNALLTAVSGNTEKRVLALLNEWWLKHVNLSQMDVQTARVRELILQLEKRNADSKTKLFPRLQLRLITDDVNVNSELLNLTNEGPSLRVSRDVLMDESHVRSASAMGDESSGSIKLVFNDAGGRKFAELISKYDGRKLGVVLDGGLYAEKTISAATMNDWSIEPLMVISGNLSKEEADRLAAAITTAIQTAAAKSKPDQTQDR